jgi:hypothetical protein
MGVSSKYILLVALALLVLLPAGADAFGAGNIASISRIEGKNWRHGDIEDMLATVACLKGHKWKSNMIKVTFNPSFPQMTKLILNTACLLWQLAKGLLAGLSEYPLTRQTILTALGCRCWNLGQGTG